jgi:hypothetical protein
MMTMIVEQSVKYELAGETEVLGENLPQCHFVHDRSQWPDLGLNPGCCGGKPATNRLSYGTVTRSTYFELKDGGSTYLRNVCNTAHMHTV